MMSSSFDLSVALLHESMVDKQGKLVTTSLTLNDIQDLARSSRTYCVRALYIAHPSEGLKKLSHTLLTHWEEGFGSTYNPDRKEAMRTVDIVNSLDDAIMKIELRTKRLPKLIASSARGGEDRTSFSSMHQEVFNNPDQPYLLMLGTGWGMSDELMKRADYTLEPISGPGEFNHLSVRSACAILLDRLIS